MEQRMVATHNHEAVIKATTNLKKLFHQLPDEIKHAESLSKQTLPGLIDDIKQNLSVYSSQKGRSTYQDLKNLIKELDTIRETLQIVISASSPQEWEDRYTRGIMSSNEHEDTKWRHVTALDSPYFKDMLKLCFEQASTSRHSFMFIGVNKTSLTDDQLNSMGDDRTDHWVAVSISRNSVTGELNTDYFNSVPEYHHVPLKISKTLSELARKVPNLKIQSHINKLATTNLQKNNVDCAAFCALYIYLTKLKHRDLSSFSPSNPQDKIICDLIGEQEMRDIHRKIFEGITTPTQVMHELTSTDSAKFMEALKALEFQHLIELEGVKDIQKDLESVLEKLNKVFNDPNIQDSDKILLAISLLSLGSGIVTHLMLATALGSGGTAFSAYRILSTKRTFENVEDDFTVLASAPKP